MTADLQGPPIAIGRSARIHRWDQQDDVVVKVFAADYPSDLVDAEAQACREAHRLDLTPIDCLGRVDVGGQPGLLFDRLHGISLTRRAERNPLTVRSGSRALARVHARVHGATTTRFRDVRVVVVDALSSRPLAFLSPEQRSAAERQVRALPSGDRVLHMDFHTENVFTHDGGHAVIDWQTAARGAPAADAAATVLLIRDAELWPGTPALKRAATQAVRRIVLRTYLREYERLTGIDEEQIDAWRVPAVVLRMSTLDVDSERPRLRRELVDRIEGRR
ncbi:phosphotransferase [Patulibacter sp. S7RM1-6]